MLCLISSNFQISFFVYAKSNIFKYFHDAFTCAIYFLLIYITQS